MLRQVDVLVHLIRTYEDDDIPFFENKLDPVRDIHIVHQELLLMVTITITITITISIIVISTCENDQI